MKKHDENLKVLFCFLIWSRTAIVTEVRSQNDKFEKDGENKLNCVIFGFRFRRIV